MNDKEIAIARIARQIRLLGILDTCTDFAEAGEAAVLELAGMVESGAIIAGELQLVRDILQRSGPKPCSFALSLAQTFATRRKARIAR